MRTREGGGGDEKSENMEREDLETERANGGVSRTSGDVGLGSVAGGTRGARYLSFAGSDHANLEARVRESLGSGALTLVAHSHSGFIIVANNGRSLTFEGDDWEQCELLTRLRELGMLAIEEVDSAQEIGGCDDGALPALEETGICDNM